MCQALRTSSLRVLVFENKSIGGDLGIVGMARLERPAAINLIAVRAVAQWAALCGGAVRQTHHGY
jgi:hypothetical protein